MASNSDVTPSKASHGQLIKHPNGQTTHIIIDDFTDPWKPSETILIQPGFGRHHAFWYHWIPELARQYRVVRRDLRGHGYSSSPDPSYDYSLETVLGEIVDLLNQLNIKKVHFFGESTGGMVAVAFAAKHPDRCLSLTTCATPTHLPDAAIKSWSLGYESWQSAMRTLGSRGYMEALTKLPGGIGQPDPDYSKWWLDQVGLNSTEGFVRYSQFLQTLDIRPFYKDIEASGLPVLILAPTRSSNTSLDDQKLQQKSMAGSKLVEIDGFGHEIYIDRAKDCQKALLDFLSTIKLV